MSLLQKVINIVNPCLTPRFALGGEVLNNEQFAKAPFRACPDLSGGFRGEITFWSGLNY